MKKLLLSSLSLILFGFSPLIAQESTSKVYTIVEEMPIFPDCDSLDSYDEQLQCTNKMIYNFIGKETIYPKEAEEKKVEGSVYIQYIVDEFGKVNNVEVMRGLSGKEGELLNQEAVRVISSLPTMKPGKQDGKAVRVQYTIPLKFRVNKDTN